MAPRSEFFEERRSFLAKRCFEEIESHKRWKLNAEHLYREDVRGCEVITCVSSVATTVEQFEPATSKRRKFSPAEIDSEIEPQISAGLIVLKDSCQPGNIQVQASPS